MRGPVGLFAGLCTLDVVYDVDRLPGPDEKVTARGQLVAAGGPATNAAVTFAALGGRATLVTALGGGILADAVHSDLATNDVAVIDVAPDRSDAVPVSSISVLAESGARSVVSVDASGFVLDDVPDLRPLLAGSQVALVDGHHPTLARSAAGAAAAAGVPVLVDAGRWRPAMPHVLQHAHTVVCSAAFRWPDSPDADASARALVQRGLPVVAVTHGGAPIRWWSGGRSGQLAPPRVAVIDTAGAGDAFHGAYAYAMAAFPGSPVQRRLAFAAGVASIKCQYRGTRGWLGELRRVGAESLW